MFSGSTLLAGPKHSTSVPFSAESAVPLSVDVKEVASFIPNSLPGLAVKASLGPQREEEVDLCDKAHSLVPPTLQVVIPPMSPVTAHLKMKVSPRQVGGAAVNCPATSPGEKWSYVNPHVYWYVKLVFSISCHVQNMTYRGQWEFLRLFRLHQK